MMHACASAAKLRGGGPILKAGIAAMGESGTPPPRTVIANPSRLSGRERSHNLGRKHQWVSSIRRREPYCSRVKMTLQDEVVLVLAPGNGRSAGAFRRNEPALLMILTVELAGTCMSASPAKNTVDSWLKTKLGTSRPYHDPAALGTPFITIVTHSRPTGSPPAPAVMAIGALKWTR